MSKKKKNYSTGPKSRPSRPAGTAGAAGPAASTRPGNPTGGAINGAVGRAARELKSTAEARLLAQFGRWYATHLDTRRGKEDTHGEVEAVLATLDVLMDMTRTLGPRMTLATPTARTVQALIDYTIQLSASTGSDDVSDADGADLTVENMSGDDSLSDGLAETERMELSERVEALVDVLEHYLDFLGETSSWRASDDEYNASYAVLAHAINTLTVVGEFVSLLLHAVGAVEAVAPDRQLLALNALPIVAGVDGLLEWLGTSKPVTSTGSVRLADIQRIAALIGLNAVGERGAANSELAHSLYEVATASTPGEASPNTEPQPAGTMWDISALGTWWVTLSQAGIISVGATTVRPGAEAGEWRSADAAAQLSIRSEFVERYVQEWLEREATNESPESAHTLTRVISMLVAAVDPEVLSSNGSARVADAVDGELHYDAADAPAAFSASMVMHQLAKAGLLESAQAEDGTTRYLAPEALRPTLALTISPLVEALA